MTTRKKAAPKAEANKPEPKKEVSAETTDTEATVQEAQSALETSTQSSSDGSTSSDSEGADADAAADNSAQALVNDGLELSADNHSMQDEVSTAITNTEETTAQEVQNASSPAPVMEKTKPMKANNAHRRGVFGTLRIRAVMKAGFFRCGRQFAHDDETVLHVVAHPVARNQISIAQAKKLKAERMLIVKEE